jgi:hypothetical protein
MYIYIYWNNIYIILENNNIYKKTYNPIYLNIYIVYNIINVYIYVHLIYFIIIIKKNIYNILYIIIYYIYIHNVT